MSRDLNKVQLIGRLGKDPELKYTPQGSAVVTMNIASSRSWRTAEGENREDTEWFRVVAWDKLAEVCGQYLKKGSRVYMEGRLQTRSWDDKESGQKRYSTEVVASDMIMLDTKREGANGGGGDENGDTGYEDVPAPEASPEPVRSTPARAASAPPRSAPAPAARPNAAPRRPVAAVQVDDEDLPF